jgi:hypothetical protein
MWAVRTKRRLLWLQRRENRADQPMAETLAIARRSSLRTALLVTALGVICAWFVMRKLGVGIATTVPALNAFLGFAAMARLTFELAMQLAISRTFMRKAVVGICTLLLGLVTLFTGLLVVPTAGDGITVLAEVPASHGKLIAFQISLPLTSDWVIVEKQVAVLPGIYLFQERAVLSTAWNAVAQVTQAGGLLISYTDEDDRPRALAISQ